MNFDSGDKVKDEKMSIVTQINPRWEDTTKYKEKICVLKLVEISEFGKAVVGHVSFNLVDFLDIDPTTYLKLDFHNSKYKDSSVIISVKATHLHSPEVNALTVAKPLKSRSATWVGSWPDHNRAKSWLKNELTSSQNQLKECEEKA